MTPGEFRLRVRFSKSGRLRWLSHLEVVHALERGVRRAGLDYAVTQGFSPHMKLAFGPALPVGTAGENEYFDVWLTRYSDATALLQRLIAVSPEDLSPREARFIGDGEPSLGAAVTIGVYRVEVDGKEEMSSNAQEALDALMARGTLEVEHKGKSKVFDLARGVSKDPLATGRQGGVDIELAVRMGPDGSLRPEALVRAALETSGLEASAVRTTRLDTFVENDDGEWSRPV